MSFLHRVLGWLLRLFPTVFRERYGEEVIDVLVSKTRDTHVRLGWTGVVRMWAFQSWDILRSAAAERKGERHSGRKEGRAGRQADGFFTMGGLSQDAKYALRRLAGHPFMALASVLTLAIALGANSAMFAIVDPLLLRPVIRVDSGEIVNLYTARSAADRSYRPFSFREYSSLREFDELFTRVAAFHPTFVGIGEGLGKDRKRHFGFLVSDDYFTTLGENPVVGRFFFPEESVPGAGIPVAVASYDMWQSHGGEADILGRTIHINGNPWEIIGVAPEGFTGGNALIGPNIWLPLGMAHALGLGGGGDLADPATFSLYVMARLSPGVTLQAAKSRLGTIAAALSEVAPDPAGGTRTLEIERPSRFNIDSEPASDGPLALFGLLLVCMSGIVLLIACLNLANMFLAQGTSRTEELRVRLALGASPGRVVRLLFVEALIVALLGAAMGLPLSYWANTLLLDSLSSSSVFATLGASLALDVTPDARVFLATLALCGLASLIFGAGPAVRVTRGEARGTLSLHTAERNATGGSGRTFSGRNFLTMGQLALSVSLLFAAALFSRGAQSAANLDPGFEAEGDLVVEIDYSLSNRGEAAVWDRLLSSLDTLRTIPSVGVVAAASHIPFGNVSQSIGIIAIGGNPTRVRGKLTAVSRDYFRTVGVRLLRGRDFTEFEWRDRDSSGVVIIDERMASSLFPNDDPIGRSIQENDSDGTPTSPPLEIVGVVSAHRDDLLSDRPPARIFVPLGKKPMRRAFVHVRGMEGTAPTTLAGTVRGALLSVDPELPLVRLVPFTTILENNTELWAVRFAAALFGSFGLIALILSVVGVYGVKAFMVARRNREIGIRLALGARPRDVVSLLTIQGAVQVAVGVSVGLLLSLVTGRLLASMLVSGSPNDPFALILAALPLAGAGLVATYLPARRAVRTDPVEALRGD
jgi:predicted permease